MVKLLRLDTQKPSDRIDCTDANGQPIQFLRSKWETVDNLRKVGGDPDEIHKIPMKVEEPRREGRPVWKMYTWGPLVVLADDTGHARYFALTKENRRCPGARSPPGPKRNQAHKD